MITLREARSKEIVKQILTEDELFDRIAEDGHTKEDFDVPFDGSQRYMLVCLNGDPIGVWCLYPVNSATLNIHCNMLKDYRCHSMEAARLILEWFVNDAPAQYKKLNAEIPMVYPDVYCFTKKFGFQDEGVNRQSICKGGEMVDQWRLGLTRSEADMTINVGAAQMEV